MKFTPCLCWVPRGVAASLPHKVRVPEEDLKKLLVGSTAVNETSESESGVTGSSSKNGLRGSQPASSSSEEEGSEEEGHNDDVIKERSKKKQRKRKHSEGNDDGPEKGEEENLEKKYEMSKYDSNEEEEAVVSMKGVACFASPNEDPFISRHDGSSDQDEDDREDYEIKSSDNLLVVGRVKKDEFSLEVYVFNEEESDFYVHHDYALQAPPLCLASIGYDPGVDQSTESDRSNGSAGNLCAVGSMNPGIEIWDLDLVDALEPVAVLGVQGKKSKKAKVEGLSHSGAVLDLAWNRNMEHVLGSSGAEDSAVILWDLDKAFGATELGGGGGHSEKVQTLAWHPLEDSLLLSGSSDKSVILWDCRASEPKKRWSQLSGEVEKVGWDWKNPFCFVVGTGEGTLHYVDSRQDKVMYTEEKAHDDEISGLCSNSKLASSCIVSCGIDASVKIWTVDSEGFELKYTAPEMNLGRLHCMQFSPDSDRTLAIGGEKGDYIRLWSLSDNEELRRMLALP